MVTCCIFCSSTISLNYMIVTYLLCRQDLQKKKRPVMSSRFFPRPSFTITSTRKDLQKCLTILQLIFLDPLGRLFIWFMTFICSNRMFIYIQDEAPRNRSSNVKNDTTLNLKLDVQPYFIKFRAESV